MVEGLGAGHLAVLLYVLIALPLVGADTLGVAGSHGTVCCWDEDPSAGATREGREVNPGNMYARDLSPVWRVAPDHLCPTGRWRMREAP